MNSVLYGFTAKEEREYQKMMLREAREEGLAEGILEGRKMAEAERKRADTAEEELAKYKARFGEIKE